MSIILKSSAFFIIDGKINVGTPGESSLEEYTREIGCSAKSMKESVSHIIVSFFCNVTAIYV